jgi:hypothetical protein
MKNVLELFAGGQVFECQKYAQCAIIKLHLFIIKYIPLVILYDCTSFSQDANDAWSASLSFLFVPGVSGGICG